MLETQSIREVRKRAKSIMRIRSNVLVRINLTLKPLCTNRRKYVYTDIEI